MIIAALVSTIRKMLMVVPYAIKHAKLVKIKQISAFYVLRDTTKIV